MHPATSLRGSGDRVARSFARHPRVGHALRAAVAAAIAWALALLIPGGVDYPYYAPFGAVIAISSTLAGSVRESVQGVAAILLGALIARSIDLVSDAGLLTVALVVAAGTLVAGWHRLGVMGMWVPASALFVLIIGAGDPVGFIVAYSGLTLLGAAVAVGINLLMPPLPLTPAQVTVTNLRETLADQLDDLSDGLAQQHPLTQADWDKRRWAIEPVTARMRSMIQQTAEARRGNRRTKRFQGHADRQYEQARALERLTFLVEDLTLLVAESERADFENVALGPSLRPSAAAVIDRMAAVLRSVEQSAADPATVRAADTALQDFVTAVRETRSTTTEDLFVAGSIVVSLRRCLVSVVPTELVDTIPSA